MVNKKVGLVTYYGDNYGGCLQAYALQQTIKALGYDPKILQVSVSLKGAASSRLASVLRLLRNPVAFLRRRKYIIANTKNSVIRSQAFERFRSEFLSFDRSSMLCSEKMLGDGGYNVFVCGSDQIWNPNLYGVHPIWTMTFAPEGAKKIAYAPSLGVSSIPDEYIVGFQENLKDYTYISCREQEGASCLSKILGKKVDVVLDPTLLLSPDKWHDFARPVDIKKPYVFCYLFGDYDYIATVKKIVKAYYGLDIVCLPYNLRELKATDLKLYDITPNQFVWLIENATCVVTDSFHATVFSIKMNTPFVSLKRTSDNDKKNMNSRLYTLLKTVGLENRLVGENMVDDVVGILSTEMDFKTANERLSDYIKRDITKLETAITHE